jgi:hypothetical protein
MWVVGRCVAGTIVAVGCLVGAPAAEAQSANANHPVSVRLESGLVFHAVSVVNPGHVGYLFGAGVDVTPLPMKRIAFEVDAAYYRYRGGNNRALSGNILCYLTEAGMRPYLGGGLTATHTHVDYTSAGTQNSITLSDRNWEIVGGVTRPWHSTSSTRTMRIEGRAIFRPASVFLGGMTTTLLVIAGINF